jgi:biopolymer transport protein ExbB
MIMSAQILDLSKVYSSSPLIYGALGVLSIAALSLWLYTILTFRSRDMLPEPVVSELRSLLAAKRYEEALLSCQARPSLLGSMVSEGLSSRRHGPEVMLDAMRSRGRRDSTSAWQRLSLLNDIAIVAPMLGLLGTVIGMFYAFYDVNRSIESINSLFDGLGIAVGTTVMGLIVAILAMVLSTTLKFQVIRSLSHVESEAMNLGSLIETRN